ncbi:DUF3631 domain-containing protein [Paraburkholderia bryophila]|uniref:Putative DNA primase/helicase n=1 Tax=Paraburkholderia bryophila TaxID=420952 RepID=A0A7Z0B884_9BURK|nr:DUF3631 domain-containing protein [Paraburkholderia bryophila]NYH23958.1 putative DNA primase/helicase [Paraburkholderia bryophila]
MSGPRKTEATFAAALAAHDLTPSEIVSDGRIRRFDGPDDKRGQRNAWYVLYGDGSVSAGAFGYWKTGLSEKWCARPQRTLSAAEHKLNRERIENAQSAAAAERAKIRERAATAARRIWENAHDADDTNPYLSHKSVKSYGVKETDDNRTLIVPLHNAAGVIVNLQFINGRGEKRFKGGCEVSGCSYQFGGEPQADGVLLIGEGYATCASVHAATGAPAVVAFNCNNLLSVARAWRARLPSAQIVLAADDDHMTAGNPGVTAARAATHAIGGALAIPRFGDGRPDNASDFNDLQAFAGPDAVAACIETAYLASAQDKADTPDGRAHHTGKVSAQAAVTAQPTNSDDDVSDANGSGKQADCGSGTDNESDDDAIARLAALGTMSYDRVRRVEAKRLGVQVGTLDRLVAAIRNNGGDFPFAEIDLWSEPVDGAALLSELAVVVRRFVVCDPVTAHAAALWIAMTWLIDDVNIAPLAAISSPEKRCGKSTLLGLFARLTCRPLAASNISPAALFRSIEAWRPTLVIDEADAFAKDNEELRGLLNAGHTRDTAYVVRVVGDDFRPKQFSVWGAKAIAGIGKLADTIVDRSICFELRRRLPHEKVDKLRHAEPGLFDMLASKLARWADDNGPTVRSARVDLPDSLNDRAADNWEPLFQIAHTAGGVWPELARRAALALSGDRGQEQSVSVELLADIHEIFETQKAVRIASADLLRALLDDEEKLWATWNHGKPLSLKQLAKRLGQFGIKSRNIRSGYAVAKGYDRADFSDTFARYLFLDDFAATPLQPSTSKAYSVAGAPLQGHGKNAPATLKPIPVKADSECSGVAAKNRGIGEEHDHAGDNNAEDAL